ncbi:glycosyltransferase family 4 protein [Pedococcus bigeumensis]|uniref:D-inositol 3-phosphate glycosyltransferase n=1 Tax=Pedococcus bigeumensis TaxID=433644 RepID=A0A502D1R7_9MICO|nr:glycosyltransferase family 4 protein [Pedococcus bigeumensis]TPG19705.1 glycosyltransferase family 1 protein [Pedococcus bigeumensis]
MKVVMLVGRSTGGIGTHAVDLAEGLRALGDEVSFVTDRMTADRFAIAGALLWWPGGAVGPVESLRHLWRLRRLVRAADVVHAHGHQAGLLASIVAVGTHTPVVVSQHNAVLGSGGLKGRLSGLVQGLVARRAALTTGASSDLVDEARRHGARDTRLAAVPSPRVPGLLAQETPDTEARRALAAELLRDNGIDAEPGAPLVLTIARIAPQKDLETLVDAGGAAEPAQAPWVVVGDGDADLLSRLRRRVEAAGLPVHFVGPQDDPDRWLRAAEVFVLPSLWEARALVVQEAMAAGVPVVATETGGLTDLVSGVGTLVPVRDPSAVAAAVQRYLADPAARHTASVAGRERARSWDDGTATASRWHEWYSALPGMT